MRPDWHRCGSAWAIVAVAAMTILCTTSSAGATRTSVPFDFDGDGVAEIVIGAAGAAVGQDPRGGVVHVVRLDSSGHFEAAGRLRLPDPQGGDRFGMTVASGDFNGDGYADLTIGAPGRDTATGVDAGAVAVYYGSSGGIGDLSELTDGARSMVAGMDAGNAFGAALVVGNFNGDGYADLAVGLPGAAANGIGTGGHGRVEIYFGSADGLQMAEARNSGSGYEEWDENSPGIDMSGGGLDLFGASLSAGDIDGDGYNDLVIGVPRRAQTSKDLTYDDAGAVVVLYGSGDGLVTMGRSQFSEVSPGVEGSPGVQTNSADKSWGDQFGSVTAIGDLDGDGYGDVAVGMPDKDPEGNQEGPHFRGAVDVLYGSADGLTTRSVMISQASRHIPGKLRSDARFGSALVISHLNRDRYADLLIGAPHDSVAGVRGAGSVVMIPGSSQGPRLSDALRVSQEMDGVPGHARPGDRFGATLNCLSHGGQTATVLVAVPSKDVKGSRNAGAVVTLAVAKRGIAPAGSRYLTERAKFIRGPARSKDRFGQVSGSRGSTDSSGYAD